MKIRTQESPNEIRDKYLYSPFINFIEDIDPDSVIVLQGDHGFKNDDNFIKNDDINKFKIFNLIKTPKDCNDDYKLKKNLGNINSIRIHISTVESLWRRC